MNYFYHPNPASDNQLSAEESFHCIKVLRKKLNDQIDIIDGKGNIYKANIEKDSHRACLFSIVEKKSLAKEKNYYTHIAIAPTKNQDRLEWFVEKACELGVDEVSFIQTKRTERKKINLERLEKKAVSAMKQSKNLFKAQINKLLAFDDFMNNDFEEVQKFIAFVDNQNDVKLSKTVSANSSSLIMIGPEGDFTDEELGFAVGQGFQMVSLGDNVLRTETAGIVACHTVELVNDFHN